MNFFKKQIIIFLLFTSFLTSKSFAEVNLKVVGNNRISIQTIKEIINFDKNKNYGEPIILNSVQQKLYSSGFFKNVSTSYSNNFLNLKLTENPLVDFFYIKGLLNKSREEFLYQNLEIKTNTIFSNDKLKKDIETIKSVFSQSGYLDIKVIPKVSETENNLINIVLEVDRGEKFLINRLYFIGDKYFKNSVLTDVVDSSEFGWWKFLSTTSTLSLARIDSDKRLLKSFYLDNGFYDVQIISSDVTIDNNKKANIVFSINSGPIYSFNKIEILDLEKNLSIKDLEYLKSYISKKLKGTYSLKKVFNTKNYLENYLIDKKIEFIKIDFKLSKEDLVNKKINVTYSFTPENKKYINLINIKGNSITEEKIIRDNMVLSEGDGYMNYKLVRSIDNIRSTKIFKKVDYKLSENSSNSLIDLDIKVEEQPTGQISAGVGIGSSGSTISTGIQENNLFGKGIASSGVLSLGTEKISGNMNLKLPKYGVNENDIFVNFGISEIEYDNGAYKSKQVVFGAGQSYEIYEDISLLTSLNFDNDRIDTKSSTSSYIRSLDGNYNTLKASYGITNDKRDRKFKTSSGHITNFTQGLAIPGSDIPYFQNKISMLYYYPIAKDYTFNIKSGLSTINALNNKNIKLSDRLTLSNKRLRGFESRGVGPKDGKDFIGGNYSAYLGFSSTIPNPLPERWNANTNIFLDSGNVWGVDYDSSKDSSKLRSSIGLSLDWTSPLGPLSFTLAQPISSAKSDKEEKFSFQLGSSF